MVRKDELIQVEGIKKKKKKVKEDKKITLVETIKDISIKEVTMSMTLDE